MRQHGTRHTHVERVDLAVEVVHALAADGRAPVLAVLEHDLRVRGVILPCAQKPPTCVLGPGSMIPPGGYTPEEVLVVRGLALGRDNALGKALLAELRGELRLLLLAFGRHIGERACGLVRMGVRAIAGRVPALYTMTSTAASGRRSARRKDPHISLFGG
jgi:hypothetical protein